MTNVIDKCYFYGDLVYKVKKIVGTYTNKFSAQVVKIISHYKILVITGYLK